MFKTIGIITKPDDNFSSTLATKLTKHLTKLNINVVFYQKDIIVKAKLIIILGGDGTFINTAREFVDYDIPILGVNLGNLGFLTDINIDAMFDAIEDILSGNYNIEQRFMLQCSMIDGSKYCAVNDVVVHRSSSAKMVKVNTYLNDRFVNRGLADGLIISTPTGSTAYALSSGGPIINNGVNAISLVYISPHAMTYRPFIFNANDKIKIDIKEPKNGAKIIIDGQITINVCAGESICVEKYHKKIKLIHPHNYDFFAILRDKLHWTK